MIVRLLSMFEDKLIDVKEGRVIAGEREREREGVVDYNGYGGGRGDDYKKDKEK